MTLARVQGNARGTSTGNSIGVSLSSVPTSGNMLIAVIGTFAASYATVSGISQTGVTWTQQKTSQAATSNPYYMNCEIWAGVVGSGASQNLTINMAANAAYGGIANVCEYSDLLTSSFLDQTASNNDTGGSNPTDTGTTSATTQASELAIGASFSCGGTTTQSSPTNGFTLLDGATYGSYTSLGYLEKILSATGTQNSGATASISSWWVGCIATFKASTGGGTNLEVTGNLTVDGVINSHVSGASPVANSNTGMILDCYTPNHRDGLGIQTGGIWLKYDDSFNIYNDNGSTLLQAVNLDNSGNMTISGAYRSNVSSSAPGAHSSAGLKIDLWPTAHSDGIGMQNGGMWIKYGEIFDIYYDSGTAITDALHLDSVGNMTVAGGIIPGRGANIKRNADYVTINSRVLPTESNQYKTYTDLGHGNILFEHIGTADANHNFPPIDQDEIHWGRYANIYQIMLQDPLDNTVYQPIIAMDRGLWVEKDIQAYGALFTLSDPGKGTGGGAVYIGHGMFNTGTPPCIVVPDSGYNTLHLVSDVSNLTRAHLSLGALDAQANVKIGIFSNTADRGPLYASSSGYIGYPQSTIRVKENVQDLHDCSWLYSLRPVAFTWKDRERAVEGTRLGLIAEEVNEQCPQLTWLDSEGKPEGIHYEWLGIPLIVEIKKLRNQVDSLQTQVQRLTKKMVAQD